MQSAHGASGECPGHIGASQFRRHSSGICARASCHRFLSQPISVTAFQMRLTWPLAIMPSADQVPVKSPHSTMHWHMWVVLIAGSTGSALRAVRPPNLHIMRRLLLQLIEKAPVGSLRDDPAGAQLDDARLPQTQGPEPHRVLGFVLPPLETD